MPTVAQATSYKLTDYEPDEDSVQTLDNPPAPPVQTYPGADPALRAPVPQIGNAGPDSQRSYYNAGRIPQTRVPILDSLASLNSGVQLTLPLPVAEGGTGTATPSLVAGVNVTVKGAWPNQTIDAVSGAAGITQLTGDVAAGAGSGSQPATVTNTHLLAPLPIAQGGTGTTTPSLVNGTNTTVSGSWPAQAVNVAGGTAVVGAGINGGGSTPALGVQGYAVLPFNGTITGWTVTADQAGSATIDVCFLPGSAPPASPSVPSTSNKISASAPITLSAQTSAGGAAAIASWGTSLSQWGTIMFNLTSVSTVTSLLIEIFVSKS